MNSANWDRAQELTKRSYIVTTEQDTLSDGQVIYLLSHPELPGCKAQGVSVNEAKLNLDSARTDYIYALLEMGLSVPEPGSIVYAASTPTSRTYVVNAASAEQTGEGVEEIVGKDVQARHRTTVSSLQARGQFYPRSLETLV